jgi:hypothetical protein
MAGFMKWMKKNRLKQQFSKQLKGTPISKVLGKGDDHIIEIYFELSEMINRLDKFIKVPPKSPEDIIGKMAVLETFRHSLKSIYDSLDVTKEQSAENFDFESLGSIRETIKKIYKVEGDEDAHKKSPSYIG